MITLQEIRDKFEDHLGPETMISFARRKRINPSSLSLTLNARRRSVPREIAKVIARAAGVEWYNVVEAVENAEDDGRKRKRR